MEKKGQLVGRELVAIIASAIVIAAFYVAGNSYGSQEAYYKLAVARDLALTIDMMYALQGDVQYTYPNDISDYGLEIKGNTIKVYNNKRGKQDTMAASHNFAGTYAAALNAEVVNKKFVKFEKTGDKISISGVDG